METTTQKDVSQMTLEELNLQPYAIASAEINRRESQKVQMRETYKELIEEIVPGLVDGLIYISEGMRHSKANIFNQFKDIIKMKAEAFGVSEDQMSHTFTSKCGKSITIGFRVVDGWDDSYSAGVAKVNKVLESMSKDENSAVLVKGIFKLLKKDDKGNLKQTRIMELKAMAQESGNSEFIDGVEIILAAHKPVQSNWFIEAYHKKDGNKQNIPLALSSVEFPEDFQFDFFNPQNQ